MISYIKPFYYEENNMTRNEKKKNNAKQRRRMILSLSLMLVGLVMVVTALIMEASNYPWGILFGTATQNAETIADPAPIILDKEDKDVIVTAASPSPEISAADPSPTEAAAASDTSPSAAADLPGNEEDTEKAPAVSKYVILGTFKIPVLGVSQNLLEGAGKEMKYGVGHLPTTAAVGQKGNCAIAGHRPYPFRYLDQIKTGDNIVIKTGGHTYTYSVFDSLTVLPTEVWVLNNVQGEDYTLTIITCTPYMVSSHRLIIRARLTIIDGITPQEYYGEVSPDTISPDVLPTDLAEPSNTDAAAVETAVIPDETVSPSAVLPDPTTDIPIADTTNTDSLPVVT